MTNQQRVFHLNSEKINQIFFCDISNTEDSLSFDYEDVEFLEQDGFMRRPVHCKKCWK